MVWYNLVFSSFATPENPFAAFAGLSAPALTRAAGFFTHITLHHIIEHVDFAAAGVRQGEAVSLGTDLATRALLKAHSVSVLLPPLPRNFDHEVFRSKRAAGHTRNLCVHSQPSGFYETRQSGSSHSGDRTLGNL